MSKLPRDVTAARAIRALLGAGFYVHHQEGSHVNLRHPIKYHLHIVVPYHRGYLAPKTLRSIIRQAELTLEEFKDLI